MVRYLFLLLPLRPQNDEIEKLGSERTAIYRKCRLEEIELPLVSGSLDDVPLEEVSARKHARGLLCAEWQKLTGRPSAHITERRDSADGLR